MKKKVNAVIKFIFWLKIFEMCLLNRIYVLIKPYF